MSLYVKSPIEKMNDELENELNSIPEELTFEADDTEYTCPDCSTTLKKLKFIDPHNQKLSVNWDMLYCTQCNNYHYLHDIIWKLKGGTINNGGQGSGTSSGGSKVKVIDHQLVITDN